MCGSTESSVKDDKPNRCIFDYEIKASMKAPFIVTYACLSFVICICSISGNATTDLHVRAVLTTGEHSKDSSSQTTTITVMPDAILCERSFGGHRRRASPVRKKFRLTEADKASLGNLIASNNLLVTGSVKLPRGNSNYRYFEISLAITLGGKKGAIDISAPRAAVKVKEEKLYRDSLKVVEELYRIMKRQDKSMVFSELEF